MVAIVHIVETTTTTTCLKSLLPYIKREDLSINGGWVFCNYQTSLCVSSCLLHDTVTELICSQCKTDNSTIATPTEPPLFVCLCSRNESRHMFLGYCQKQNMNTSNILAKRFVGVCIRWCFIVCSCLWYVVTINKVLYNLADRYKSFQLQTMDGSNETMKRKDLSKNGGSAFFSITKLTSYTG